MRARRLTTPSGSAAATEDAHARVPGERDSLPLGEAIDTDDALQRAEQSAKDAFRWGLETRRLRRDSRWRTAASLWTSPPAYTGKCASGCSEYPPRSR
jgi:hypothetical protein